MIPLGYFIIVGLILFLLGLYTCLTRINAIGILIGIELILNAAGLNFVAFAHARGNDTDGHVMTLFIIILAAAEAVVALAVLLGIYRRFGAIDTSKTVTLKE
ncbi:MAG: NADH-quinone oxidoreductase subunit NuoK [Deltaproteobacteria bacterium CG11_big_fil_rev_8_21_14_0_20_49_13]|nr:MAG: NADH-quinone oxidoreductase subunit NuoK [Deltaproteobacteria bacterium CG11_big_fil_rev_8_21_14_0_20_49_13]